MGKLITYCCPCSNSSFKYEMCFQKLESFVSKYTLKNILCSPQTNISTTMPSVVLFQIQLRILVVSSKGVLVFQTRPNLSLYSPCYTEACNELCGAQLRLIELRQLSYLRICWSRDEPFATLCKIWSARDLNSRPQAHQPFGHRGDGFTVRLFYNLVYTRATSNCYRYRIWINVSSLWKYLSILQIFCTTIYVTILWMGAIYKFNIYTSTFLLKHIYWLIGFSFYEPWKINLFG